LDSHIYTVLRKQQQIDQQSKSEYNESIVK